MTLPRWIAELLWVGAGGFFGASLRYAVSGGVHRFAAPTFPWGILTVNAAGCLLIGLLAGLAESRHVLTDATRLFLLVGLLGGFTTFSTFGYETFELARDGDWTRAGSNVLLQFSGCLVAVWGGFSLAKLW